MKKIFDWIKAARIIKERNIKEAEAALYEDIHYTGGTILVDGFPYTKGYTFLASDWATPALIYHINNEEIVAIECYVTSDNNPHRWNEKTKWPKEAFEVLRK